MTALGNITLVTVFHYLTAFVTVNSILGTILPPYEWFAAFPRFQSGYRIFTMIIGRWGSLNFKSILYPSIASTANVNTVGTGGGDPTPAIVAVQVEKVTPNPKP